MPIPLPRHYFYISYQDATRLRIPHSSAPKVAVGDCTNPIENDLSGLAVGQTTSGAELVASWVPDARVVKAFNTVGFEIMAAPEFGGRAATMLIAGDDKAANAIVFDLAREIGFDPVNSGPLAIARLLEPMALLWINLALIQGYGTRIAFQLERK